MPFRNEHAARIASPKKFKRFRRQNDAFGPGIDVIWGIAGDDGVVEVQAVRFDARRWTVERARAWLRKHDYDPILFEEAE